ncbi:CHAP domain-containing protein [Spirillospora sp. CA-255316]
MTGKHRKSDALCITLRTTGALIAGATLIGLAAATAQISLDSTGGASPQRPAAMMAAGSAAKAEPKAKKGQKGQKGEKKRGKKSSSSNSAKAKRDKRKKPTAQDAIKMARSQVGISEDGGGQTKFQDWYKSTDRARETVERDGGSLEGYDDAAWCSMFISWIGDRIGLRDEVGMDAWTVAHAEWFKDQGRWGTEPRPGAIVFFNWNGSKDINDIVHVGMVIKDNGDGTVKTVEGNTSNAVMVRERSTGSIVGYGYPDYANSK